MSRPYQMCVRCIMDTTDPDIEFDENGYCNHCRRCEQLQTGLSESESQQKLNELITKIKYNGKNKDYDCIVGVCGGVDSTYVAYLVKKWD